VVVAIEAAILPPTAAGKSSFQHTFQADAVLNFVQETAKGAGTKVPESAQTVSVCPSR